MMPGAMALLDYLFTDSPEEDTVINVPEWRENVKNILFLDFNNDEFLKLISKFPLLYQKMTSNKNGILFMKVMAKRKKPSFFKGLFQSRQRKNFLMAKPQVSIADCL